MKYLQWSTTDKNMPYKEVTITIIDLCQHASVLLNKLRQYNEQIKQNPTQKDQIIATAKTQKIEWAQKCVNILCDNGLQIEIEEFLNYKSTALTDTSLTSELSDIKHYLKDRKDFLINTAKEIESKKGEKELIPLKIDEIDNFCAIRAIGFDEVKDFTNSAFLEDDVEESILEALVEPYKELDSGAETRDLFTDKIIVNGNRLNTAIMFKGRGVAGPLSLDKCGTKGNQLLKLAKNNAAECFIVQHVNKIEADVKETLFDLVRMNARFKKVYVCFIDGIDTARLLKSMGKNLEELRNKKVTQSK